MKIIQQEYVLVNRTSTHALTNRASSVATIDSETDPAYLKMLAKFFPVGSSH